SAINAIHFHVSRRIDEQAANQVGKLVSRGSAYRPIAAKALSGGQDFFYDNVDLLPRFFGGPILALGGPVLQMPQEVYPNVKSVGMVDPQAIHLPERDQIQDQAVGSGEDSTILHA